MNKTLLIIIIVAVIAFLIVLSVIYFDNIKTFISNKFKRKSKKNNDQPKEKKSESISRSQL